MTAPGVTLARPATRADMQRIGALIVDSLIVAALQAGVASAFGVRRIINGTVTTTLDWAWLPIVLFILYFTAQEALFGATIGKWLAGLRVVDVRGGRLTLRAAVLRNLLRPIDGLPVCYIVGAISASCSPLRQRLGDRLAGTTVVDMAWAPRARLTVREQRFRLLAVCAVLALSLVAYIRFLYYGRPPLVAASYVNTTDFLWQPGQTQPPTSYTLGAPQWGDTTVTYAIHYVPAKSTQTCHATLTLRWMGYLPGEGWQPGYGSVDRCAGQEQP